MLPSILQNYYSQKTKSLLDSLLYYFLTSGFNMQGTLLSGRKIQLHLSVYGRDSVMCLPQGDFIIPRVCIQCPSNKARRILFLEKITSSIRGWTIALAHPDKCHTSIYSFCRSYLSWLLISNLYYYGKIHIM